MKPLPELASVQDMLRFSVSLMHEAQGVFRPRQRHAWRDAVVGPAHAPRLGYA